MQSGLAATASARPGIEVHSNAIAGLERGADTPDYFVQVGNDVDRRDAGAFALAEALTLSIPPVPRDKHRRMPYEIGRNSSRDNLAAEGRLDNVLFRRPRVGRGDSHSFTALIAANFSGSFTSATSLASHSSE